MIETLSAVPQRRYFEKPEDQLSVIMEADPVCLYLETTNRAAIFSVPPVPRTFEELEPEKDMSWELFTNIIDQFPRDCARGAAWGGRADAVLKKAAAHDPLFERPRSLRALQHQRHPVDARAVGRALIDAGLDELRVSLDAAESSVFQMVRGKDMFDRIVTNVGNFVAMQRENNLQLPRVSLWLTGLRETLAQLEAFVRLAHRLGVMEVYLQRMVYLPESPGD